MEDQKTPTEPTAEKLLEKARVLRQRSGVRSGKAGMLGALGMFNGKPE